MRISVKVAHCSPLPLAGEGPGVRAGPNAAPPPQPSPASGGGGIFIVGGGWVPWELA